MNIRIARYQEKTVIVKGPFDQEYLDALLRDAKRIMGLEPVKHNVRGEKTGTRPTEWKSIPRNGEYLTPPEKNTPAWKYAQRLLLLETPVMAIFFQGVTYPVSEKD